MHLCGESSRAKAGSGPRASPGRSPRRKPSTFIAISWGDRRRVSGSELIESVFFESRVDLSPGQAEETRSSGLVSPGLAQGHLEKAAFHGLDVDAFRREQC